MFKDASIEAKKGDIYNSLLILKSIWLKYPKNTKLFEEINQLKKKHHTKLNTSLNQNLIENFFALHENGKTLLVIKKLEDIFDKNNNDFYALNLLGTFNGLIKNYEAAIKFQKLSIFLNPFDANNYLNLSYTSNITNRHELALTLLEIAKLLDFKNITINKLLAEQYFKLNKIESSIKIYEYLIELNNNDIPIKLDYIKTLIKNDKIDKSLKLLETISYDMNFHDKILSLKGLAYFKIKHFEKASKLIGNSLAENPKNSDAFLVSGLIHENSGFIDKAIESYGNAINFNEKNYIALNNLAACYAYIGKVDLAITYFKKSIKIEPTFSDAKYRLGQMQIYNFEFKEGWKNFQKRWVSSDYRHKSLKTSKPLMKSLDSKNLKTLAWNEQGLGDQVMYGSMFHDLSQHVSKLIVKVDKRLINVFKDNHPNVQFFGADENVDENIYDQHIPFGHIGSYLRLSKKEFSNSIFPYISSNKTIKDNLVSKYKNSGNLLVGLSWSSSNNLLTKNKSLSLEVLLPILKINNIKFIDLEYQNSFNEVNNLHKKHGVKIFKEDTIDNFNDIEGLTSIIDACDFIISCSNTNAHLSGALFKKTYLLLAKGKGRLWNWSQFKGRSIWYPNTKIFEQTVVGNWTHPVQNLKKVILANEIKIK